MKKLLFILLSLVFIVSAMPVLASDGDAVDIGDKMVLKGGFEAVVIGFEKGKPVYQADFGAPTYLPDLKTKIDASWKLDKDGNYVSGANLFNSYVSGEFVNVSDDKLNNLSWQPEVYIKNSKLKVKDVKPKLLEVDPLNSSYTENTLEWDYGNGIVRRVRIIEGVQQEYYVINSEIDGDIEIKPNAVKNGVQPNKPAAWDDDGNAIAFSEDTNHNIKVSKDKIKDAKYPITVDPDVTFTASVYDGVIYSVQEVVYANARTAATGTINTNALYVRNDFSGVSYSVQRGFVHFDTSALEGYVITAATLDLYVWNIQDHDNEMIQIQSGMPTYPHMPLEVGDYDLTHYVTDANCGNKDITTFVLDSYNSISLDVSGLAEINTTGWTKFCLRTTGDINNNAPISSNGIFVFNAELGVNYRPRLVVTFTATNPDISMPLGASYITTEGAQLNSQVVDDGSGSMKVEDCDVRWGYGTTEMFGVGTFEDNTGTVTGSPIDLSGGFDETRVVTVVVTGAGTFDVTLPVGFTGTAFGDGTGSYATLVGNPVALAAGVTVIDTGVTVGDVLVTIDNVYDTIAAWDDNGGDYYHTDDTPNEEVTGLLVGTTYYYSVQIRNTIGTVTCATERTFTTSLGLSDMDSLSGSPNYNSIILDWGKADGAATTRIRYKLDTYPTSPTGADLSVEVYFDTGNTYVHSGLSQGTTYYYSAWGSVAGGYSANPVTLAMTTTGAKSTTDIPVPTMPASWFQVTDETYFANLQPFYSVINGFADSWGMLRENMWLASLLAFIMFIGIVLFGAFHSASFSMAFMAFMIGGFVTLHMLPLFMIGFIVLFMMGAWATRPQM